MISAASRSWAICTSIMAVAGLTVGGLAACSASSGSSFEDEVGESTANGAGTGSGDQGAGGFNASGGTGGDNGAGGFDQCATASAEATLVPVNMFVAVDKSGSMNDNNKWNNAKAAFIAFFQDPSAGTMRVALRFWPDSGCDDFSCSIDNCSLPQVDIGPLSDAGHQQSLINLFNQKFPDGNTPMSAALGGAEKWATNYQTAKEGTEKVVVLLVTDGEPNGCDENISDIAKFASDAYAAKEILTFAVGLQGSNEGSMNAIATAGNTQSGFFIGNGNAEADLLAALKQIQKSTVACTFAMPEAPDPTKPINPQKVNVKYTPSNSSDPTTIKQVSGEGACGADGGWYYDDPNDPAIITLCDASCQAVQADEGAKIEIVLGCDTQVN